MHIFTVIALLLGLVTKIFATTYSISDTIICPQLYTAFVFETIVDPTSGRVNYVDEATAIADNLSYTSDQSFVLRADYTTVLDPAGPGRNSVRVSSVATYTTHVVVFDIRHMPQGCATWPAAWEAGSDWPNNGEVDIIEGVDDIGTNIITLHTNAGCTMPWVTDQTGTTRAVDCNAAVNDDVGCSVAAAASNTSYGPSFNAIGGGWYAMERTDTYIKVWFWPRNGSPPYDVLSGSGTVNPDNWGTPAANFPNTYCDIGSKFGPNSVIINLTLCGDWAGNLFNTDECPGDCIDYVNNNPAAFVNAYWEFASVRVYE